MTIKIIEVGVKIDLKLKIKTQKLHQVLVVNGLISHFDFMHLLLTLNMLFFDKIFSITQVLRLLHIPRETGRTLNAHESYKR